MLCFLRCHRFGETKNAVFYLKGIKEVTIFFFFWVTSSIYSYKAYWILFIFEKLTLEKYMIDNYQGIILVALQPPNASEFIIWWFYMIGVSCILILFLPGILNVALCPILYLRFNEITILWFPKEGKGTTVCVSRNTFEYLVWYPSLSLHRFRA